MAAISRPTSATASSVPGTNMSGFAAARVTISFGGGTGVAAAEGVADGVVSGSVPESGELDGGGAAGAGAGAGAGAAGAGVDVADGVGVASLLESSSCCS